MSDSHEHTKVVKGAGLARGPALIIGSVLSVFGLILFFKVSGTPLSTAGFTDGTVQGQKFLGFEANAWTAWLTVAAGVLLLFGAAQHLVAKAMSLLVGLALGAAAIIALFDGDDVLGLAAANGLTALGWGIAAALLLFNTLAPRIRHEQAIDDRADRDDRTRAERDRDRVEQSPDRDREVAATDAANRDRVAAHSSSASADPRSERITSDPRSQPGAPIIDRDGSANRDGSATAPLADGSDSSTAPTEVRDTHGRVLYERKDTN